jgi:hypothetical protein
MDFNFGDLTKPATILVEKICNSIGILYEPTYIKRIAKAKAEADKIEAFSKAEISEIEKKALERMLQEASKKQNNTDNIVKAACENLSSNADPSKMDEDWISHFFDKCKIVSNVQMQSIWANLLATEANLPGSISKKTIALVATLDKNDAILFTKFCSFIISDINGQLFPLIMDNQNKIYTSTGINFETLNHLEYLGLITLNSATGFVLNITGSNLIMSYYGTPIKFTYQNTNNNQFGPTFALLTKSGKELALISGSTPNQDFLNYFLEEFNKKNIKAELI